MARVILTVSRRVNFPSRATTKALKAHRTDDRRVMSYEDVLALVDSGKYTVCTGTGEVVGPRGVVTPYAFKRRGSHKVDYYVRLYTIDAGVKKVKSIAVARLVWMVATGSPVPPGFEIHHWDEHPMHNAFRNLFCLHNLDHRKLHREAEAEEPIPF